MLARVMLALQPPALAKRVRRLLRRDDVVVDALRNRARQPLDQIAHDNYDLVVVSESLLEAAPPGTLEAIRSLPDAPEIVVLCGREDTATQARLLAAGCLAVLATGLADEVLGDALATILDRRREKLEQSLYTRRIGPKPQLSDFVSNSPAMGAFINVVRRVVASDTSLLITGETGVGKERLARAIHAESPRAAGPFVSVNCGALPDTLLESELFGHEEGAFTGASRARRGWFELAHGGTIFLDEIGELAPHLQVKLLHVLQNHEVQRLGSEKSIAVDVRVMAATNRDLAAEMEAGRFRKDLYYRLSVVTLTIPPLSQRRDDIPSLVDDYINHFRSQIPHHVEGITGEALQALVDYDWPGNVRELINVIERAMLLCEGELIGLDDLPESIGRRADGGTAGPAWLPDAAAGLPADCLDLPLREVKQRTSAAVEKAYLRAQLEATRGRVGETARRAGIEPRSLYTKMRLHGLRKEDFRPPKTT